jgi:hypothetical protein
MALEPEILMIAMAPDPGGVAIAAIVSDMKRKKIKMAAYQNSAETHSGNKMLETLF